MKNRHIFEMLPLNVQKKAAELFASFYGKEALIEVLDSEDHNSAAFERLLIALRAASMLCRFEPSVKPKKRKTIDI